MKNLIQLVLALLLTGCASLQLSTLNHDPIYDTVLIVPADVQVDTLTVSQLRWKLRTDFRFRFDFAQYALSQPRSFDWNNRVLGNRYNYYNPYTYGYNSYMSRDMMWNDWVWGYPYGNGMGWSYSWGNNSWSSNHWNSPYGWNNYYGWGNGYGWNNSSAFYGNHWNNYNRRGNVAHINGRRGSMHAAHIQAALESRRVVNRVERKLPILTVEQEVKILKDRIINSRSNDKIINNNPRIYVRPESSNNGRRRGSREIVPTKPVISRQPPAVQPRQVRGGSRAPVPQQTRSRIKPGS
tara:strand:+ start:317 stop:1201 length:885 start_codon:yes stop_codon:yes gene_type:complete